MKVTGHCHCGQIGFSAEIAADRVRVCHCSDCQRLTGSAFRTNVPVVPESFALHRGEPKVYVKTADSGNQRAQAFCPECGTPIYSGEPGDMNTVSLRVGTLDQRADLKPARQIWTRSALPWAMDLHAVARSERQ